MTYIRGQERFVYEEVVERVRDGLLVGMHWDGSTLPVGQLPWGASYPLTFVEAAPDPLLAGAKTGVIAPNTVALSEGILPPDNELEIGGPLVESVYTFFVDIYGEDRGMARTIALDVRALLTGRIQGYPVTAVLHDYSDQAKPVLPGHLISFEEVEVAYPGISDGTRLHWAVVKMQVLHTHNGGY